MNNLTKRQAEIFNFVKDEIENNGYPPTRSEISKMFGFKSPNAAEDHLKALQRKGVLDIAAGTAVRFEPGQEREVQLIPYGDGRIVHGFNQKIMGVL